MSCRARNKTKPDFRARRQRQMTAVIQRHRNRCTVKTGWLIEDVHCRYVGPRTPFPYEKVKRLEWRVCEDAEARGSAFFKNGGRLFLFRQKSQSLSTDRLLGEGHAALHVIAVRPSLLPAHLCYIPSIAPLKTTPRVFWVRGCTPMS